MSQIIKKYIGDNEVGATQIRLENDQYLEGRNSGDTADIPILKIANTSDDVVLGASIIPDSSAVNIGTDVSPFQTVYANEIYNASGCGAIAIDVANQVLNNAGGSPVLNFSSSRLVDQNGADSVNWFEPDLQVLPKSAGTARGIKFFEDTANGTESVLVKAPASLAGNVNFVLPNSNGTSGQVLQTDGSGNTTWASAGGATGGKETFVLSAGDITNGYVDLAEVAQTNTIDVLAQGSGVTIEGASYDYTVNYTGGAGGNTRVTFVNTFGSSLTAGDVIQIKYLY